MSAVLRVMDPRHDWRDDAGFWFEVALEREAIHNEFEENE